METEQSLIYLLKKHGLTLKKAFGQNFLSDGRLLKEIAEVSGIGASDTVLEIGCGAGTLTRELAKRAKKVVGYEIDARLKPVLAETLKDFDNVRLIFKDVMKESMAAIEKNLGEEFTLVANLPYYVTTPIVMNFLENSAFVKSMTVMVQEEVADRFAAQAGGKDYGAITVGINLRGGAKKVMRVPREKFTPAPNVDSAVVKIDMEKGKFSGADFKAVRNCVRAGFQSRRKTLANNLINGFGLTRERAETALSLAKIPLSARGETLSAEDYVRLTECIKSLGAGV